MPLRAAAAARWSIWLLRRGARRLALWAATTMVVGGLLGPLLKLLVGRDRPDLLDPVARAAGLLVPVRARAERHPGRRGAAAGLPAVRPGPAAAALVALWLAAVAAHGGDRAQPGRARRALDQRRAGRLAARRRGGGGHLGRVHHLAQPDRAGRSGAYPREGVEPELPSRHRTRRARGVRRSRAGVLAGPCPMSWSRSTRRVLLPLALLLRRHGAAGAPGHPGPRPDLAVHRGGRGQPGAGRPTAPPAGTTSRWCSARSPAPR